MTDLARAQSGDDPYLMDISEACSRLGIAKPTLYRLLATGKLRSVKLGPRRHKIVCESVTDLLRGSRLSDTAHNKLVAELNATFAIINSMKLRRSREEVMVALKLFVNENFQPVEADGNKAA